MYISCIFVYNTKKKKKKDCNWLPLGSLFPLGLNSILSSYSQSGSEKKGGGGGGGGGGGATLVDLWVTD